MEINKEELQTMIREFWAVNNNVHCEAMTVIFLRKIGLTDKAIDLWLEFNEGFPTITEEDEENYEDALQTTKDYFFDENDVLPIHKPKQDASGR